MVDVLPGLATANGPNAMIPIFMTILGVSLFAVGSAYRIPRVVDMDQKVFFAINDKLRPLASFFQIIWLFGRTPLTLATLFIIVLFNFSLDGAIPTVVFFFIAAIESLIKRTYHRERPFISNQKIPMLQPHLPTDASFPSGDSLRIWFLVLTLPFWIPLPGWAPVLLILIAFTVSIGRIVMGVHYPTDVLAGAGMGIIASAITYLLHYSLFSS